MRGLALSLCLVLPTQHSLVLVQPTVRHQQRRRTTLIRRSSTVAPEQPQQQHQQQFSFPAPQQQLKKKYNRTRYTAEEELRLVIASREEERLRGIKDELRDELGRLPTAREWAEAAGLDVLELARRRELARRAKAALVEAHQGLVRNVAAGYLRSHSLLNKQNKQVSGSLLEDLVQEGQLGLIHAVSKFTGDKGARLSTYATYWIRVYVAEWLRLSTASFTIPRRFVDVSNKAFRETAKLKEELGRQPTPDEVGAALGVAPAKVAKAQRLNRKSQPALSLDALSTGTSGDSAPLVASIAAPSAGSDGLAAGASVADVPSADYAREADDFALRLDIVRALEDTLDHSELRVVRLRYGLIDGRSHSLTECSHLLGITRHAVSAVCKRAFHRLRGSRLGDALLDYLES